MSTGDGDMRREWWKVGLARGSSVLCEALGLLGGMNGDGDAAMLDA